METVIARLQAIHLDHHAIQSKQQRKIDRLRQQLQQQKQIIADYQLLLQKLERQKTKKEQKVQKWKSKCESIIRSVPIKQEKNIKAPTEIIDLVELPEKSIDMEKEPGEEERSRFHPFNVITVEEAEQEQIDADKRGSENAPQNVIESEEEVEVEVEESGEEEEEEVFMVKINGKDYYTNNETNGSIYSITDDDDIGDEVGLYKNGKPVFH